MILAGNALGWTYAAEIFGGRITADTPSTIVGGGGNAADGYDGGKYEAGYSGHYKPRAYDAGYASHLRKAH